MMLHTQDINDMNICENLKLMNFKFYLKHVTAISSI